MSAQKDRWLDCVIRELRNDAMILFFGVSLILVSWMFLLVLDGNFSAAKKDILREGDLIPIQMNRVNDLCTFVFQEVSDPQERLLAFKEMLSKIVEEDNIFYRAEICKRTSPGDTAPAPPVAVENREKFDRLNTYQNNLLRKDFYAIVRKPLASDNYDIKLYYTTPANNSDIIRLTRRYRAYALTAVLSLAIIFTIMYFGVFLPMRKVVKCLGEAEKRAVQLLPHPRTLIETVYNRLARNAILQQVGLALSDWGSSVDAVAAVQTKEGLAQAASKMLPLLMQSRLFSDIRFFFANSSGFEQAASAKDEPLSLSEIETGLQIVLADGQICLLHATESRNTFADHHFAASLLFVEEQTYGAIVLRKADQEPEVTAEDKAMVSDTAKQIEQTLSQISAHLLRTEKQKADISVALSTSMGHDLTNMIATSKWDIRTVQMYLDKVLPKIGDDRQAQIFVQSLSGLLNNMQLLQEVVDLYRSLGLTKKPQYEFCKIAELVDDAVNLFQFSTSRNVILETHHQSDLPLLPVEPRLLKVALFNLLSNAGQACAKWSIQLGQSEERYVGNIYVFTRTLDDGRIAIEIRDNGTGFMDKQGRRLPPDQIYKVFQSGYTTKTGRVAGGLGLSWVQTIIGELHGGNIHAENLDPNGALIRLDLPIRDIPEAIRRS